MAQPRREAAVVARETAELLAGNAERRAEAQQFHTRRLLKGDVERLPGGRRRRGQPAQQQVFDGPRQYIEQRDQLAAIDRAAAVHDIAAGDALARRQRLGREPPLLRRAGPGQIQRLDDVRIRRHHVHHVVRYDRSCFLAFVDRQRKREQRHQLRDVLRCDLCQG